MRMMHMLALNESGGTHCIQRRRSAGEHYASIAVLGRHA